MLIPKSEEEAKLLSVSGYRPITLCNVDYKMFAKVLARRLQSVTTVLVGSTRHVVLRVAPFRQTYIRTKLARAFLSSGGPDGNAPD